MELLDLGSDVLKTIAYYTDDLLTLRLVSSHFTFINNSHTFLKKWGNKLLRFYVSTHSEHAFQLLTNLNNIYIKINYEKLLNVAFHYWNKSFIINPFKKTGTLPDLNITLEQYFELTKILESYEINNKQFIQHLIKNHKTDDLRKIKNKKNFETLDCQLLIAFYFCDYDFLNNHSHELWRNKYSLYFFTDDHSLIKPCIELLSKTYTNIFYLHDCNLELLKLTMCSVVDKTIIYSFVKNSNPNNDVIEFLLKHFSDELDKNDQFGILIRFCRMNPEKDYNFLKKYLPGLNEKDYEKIEIERTYRKKDFKMTVEFVNKIALTNKNNLDSLLYYCADINNREIVSYILNTYYLTHYRLDLLLEIVIRNGRRKMFDIVVERILKNGNQMVCTFHHVPNLSASSVILLFRAITFSKTYDFFQFILSY